MPPGLYPRRGLVVGFLRRHLLTAPTLAILNICATAQQPASPLTPERELATFQFADEELMIELVASEPDVVSPVAIAWDADGRLFVAEMLDYPNSTNGGRIKLLEAGDGQGRNEHAKVFADNLPFPNGVLPWNRGVLVTAAPDILFLKDTDGDGRADEKRVVLTGFGRGNQQLRVNGLFWGLDNWVYGANGRSDGEIRKADAPTGKAVSIRGHDFRFNPGTGEFETIAGRSQFGAARDDWGDRFLSWNTIPIRHDVLPERYLNRNPSLAPTESVLDILSPGDDSRVFPLTPPPLVFNTESSSHFNALSGLTIYRGDGLGEKYRGNAFVGESLRNLVHRRVLEPNGVTFTALRGEIGKEFLASTDPWFHPVNFATGPDGALYVVDFYRRFVEHPDFVPENLREQIPWRAGAEHGRIWRIRAKHPAQTRTFTRPLLSSASSEELVRQLANPNAWWRDTAQRLLVERRGRKSIPLLKAVARNQQSDKALARVTALWTLDGIGELDEVTLRKALGDREPATREQAVRLSERRLNAIAAISKRLCQLADDPSERVRFQLALSLGEWNSESRLDALTKLALRDFDGRWMSLAMLTSVGTNAGPFLRKLAQSDPRWLSAPSPEQALTVERLGKMIGEQGDQTELTRCLELLSKSTAPSSTSGHLCVLAGLADGLAHSSRSLRRLMSEPATAHEATTPSLNRLVESAASTAASSNEVTPRRLLAVRILAQARPESGSQVLFELLQPKQPDEIQSAAVEALVGFGDRELARKLFAGCRDYSASTRRLLAGAALRSTAALTPLIDALESGLIRPEELDPSTRAGLRNIQNPELAARVRKYVEPVSAGSRADVVKSFQPSLGMSGDRQRGAATFAKLCVTCHAVEGKGNHVGPDLSGVASRPREALLVDILDPSRQVTPDFISYTLTTTQGETVTGLLVAESANNITLRPVGQPDATFPRAQISGLRAEGKSLMPDGLEQGLTRQDVADLLEFLQHPDSKLLRETK
jgi:putative membrane-bound dehydrogenase-like protein